MVGKTLGAELNHKKTPVRRSDGPGFDWQPGEPGRSTHIMGITACLLSSRKKWKYNDGRKRASLTHSGKIFEKPGLITLAVQHLMERNKGEGCGELNRS